jgi:ABC-type transporter Mla subunit MlaD
MARLKRSSAVLDACEKRLAGLASISESLDLGQGLTLANFRKAVEDTRALLDQYNELLSQADEMANRLRAAEKALRELSSRMLNAVAAVYGRDSSEYEMAGGVRQSERKRPQRKPPQS